MTADKKPKINWELSKALADAMADQTIRQKAEILARRRGEETAKAKKETNEEFESKA